VYEDKNGQCKIIRPEGNLWDLVTNEEKAIQHLRNVAIPDCVEFFAVKPNLILQDTTFRDAWKKGDIHEPIKIDFEKALSLHRERIQEAANKKIAQLSKELEIALENENTPQAVAIRRTVKVLRTFHELNLTHCKTPDDIKYSIPKELHDVWHFYKPTRSS
jgi:predicted AAA+ superfamily ATPase